MLPPFSSEPGSATREIASGDRVLLRGATLLHATYLQSGRITLGLLDGAVIGHRLGSAEGPCWLDAGAAVLGLPTVMDAVAETRLVLRQVPLPAFGQWIDTLPEAHAAMLRDMARAHRQQAEMAVSRLAKDAESRCAEWLLQQAEQIVGEGDARTDDSRGAASGTGASLRAGQAFPSVQLRQHKRLIAAQLGIAPETLSRVLRQLRERHFISGSGRVLSLTDTAGLRELAGV